MGIYHLEFWNGTTKVGVIRDATNVPQDGHLVELHTNLRGRCTYRVLPARTTHVFTEGGGYNDVEPNVFVEGRGLKKLDVEVVDDDALVEDAEPAGRERRRG